ncbi:MAG: hypothetical protein VB082_08030 [Christensenella sp.]|nr:hypothetical protein [Christensenella sp.]
MNGIFGNLFDLDNNGELDALERSLDLILAEDIMEEDEEDGEEEEDLNFLDDNEGEEEDF